MANLPESSTFDAGVYQLELTDPVIGGPSGVSNTPLKNLANRTKYLKDHVDSIETNFAPKASPAFSGTPTVPTAAAGTNTTQAASTAFVASAISTAAPDLSPYAPKDSPVFSGNPVAPTPAQFDNDTSMATTAFVQRAIGSYRTVISGADGVTLDASHIGACIYAGGNVNLPAASSWPAGSAVSLICTGSVGVTYQVVPNGTNKILVNQSGFTQSAVNVRAGDTLTLVSTGGSNWIAINGSAQLPFSSHFGSSLSGNGYQKLPSGMIIQWGVASNNNSTVPIIASFPIAFPNTVVSIACSGAVETSSSGAIYTCSISPHTMSQFRFKIPGYFVHSSGAYNPFPTNSVSTYWIAIGY